MSARLLAAALLLAASAPAAAQGRVTGVSAETRRIAQPLSRELAAMMAGPAPRWIAYRIATPPVRRQTCGGSHVALEPVTSVTVMVRVERGALDRVRLFTPECDIDTGTVPLTWLEGVSANDSAAWLAGLIREGSEARDWYGRVASPALAALSFHPGAEATGALIALARDDQRAEVRRRALAALGERAGQQVMTTISGAIEQDPELEVKRAAVAALARMPNGEGVPLLIDVARTSRVPDVRRAAMQRLGQSADPRAVRFFEEILK